MSNTSHLTLRRVLVARGLIDPAAPWQQLEGGRTNKLWKIGLGQRAVVCKLYVLNAANPLFANNAEAEGAALTHLSALGLAPYLLAFEKTHFGDCILYRFVEGTPWQQDTGAVARLLGRLHAVDTLQKGQFVQRASDQSFDPDGMLDKLKDRDQSDLLKLKPTDEPTQPALPKLLHGDPVPANIIMAPSGPMLIDWQCPRFGDPCDDLAIFLSPAMQHLYGSAPLSDAAIDAFLAAYPCPETATRYHRFATFYHWRMAVYCAWKVSSGSVDYKKALLLELQALERTKCK